MEPESSAPYSQVPAIWTYPEPTPSSLHPLPLPKIHLNIILTSTSGSPQWSFPPFLLLYLCSQYCFRHLGKVAKSDVSIVASVLLSVTAEQLGSRWAVFRDFFFGDISTFCQEISSLVKIGQKYQTLYMRGLCTSKEQLCTVPMPLRG